MVSSIMYTDRFELKYLIQTKNLGAILDSFGRVLMSDRNNYDNEGYFNHSIYFDTHKLRFYREKQEGLIERLKPRLRIYRDVHDFNIKSLFLEFKHKSNRTIYKQRCEINQKEADNLLLGQAPVPTDGHPITNQTIELFYSLSKRYLLRPKVAVNYKRFAYVSSLYPKLRVTFDQSLEASLDVSMDAKRSAFVDIISPRYTLVEIKYNKQLPQILSSIIKAHELKNVTFSKYSSAMEVAYEKTRPRQRYRHDLFTSAIKGRKG